MVIMRDGVVRVAIGMGLLLASAVCGWCGERITVSGLAPLHPTFLLVDYKGKLEPITGVKGDAPFVEIDGKQKRVTNARSYMPLRAPGYAPGFVKIKSQQASSSRTNLVLMFPSGGEVSGGTIDAHSDYEVTLVSDIDLPDAYLTVLFFNQEFVTGESDSPSAMVLFKKLPPLSAGKDTKVGVRFGFLDGSQTKLSYMPLVFSKGFEVRTSMANHTSHFFRRMEMLRHRRALTDYVLNTKGNQPVQPRVKVPMSLPEGFSAEGLPASVNTSFMVATDGTVESLVIEERLPREVELELRRAIGGWLFMPRMKNGYAERTMVRMPVAIAGKPAETPPAGE